MICVKIDRICKTRRSVYLFRIKLTKVKFWFDQASLFSCSLLCPFKTILNTYFTIFLNMTFS